MTKKGYLWIGNSSKPTEEEYSSREDLSLGNVSAPCVEAALSLGYTVFKGVNKKYAEELKSKYDIRFFDAGIYRSIFDVKNNYKAYKNFINFLKKEKIDVIHCNTPLGGALARLCGKKMKVLKVLYTAHGFHFYKGAPLVNRTLLKWAEMWMARYTDAIITINQEDYQAALKFKLRNKGKVYYIPGVGVNTKDYLIEDIDKAALRQSLHLSETDTVLIAMGDLVKRKNYEASIKAIAKANNKTLHFLLCGKGPQLDYLKQLATELHVENQIHFLGYRKDIKELLLISDIFLFTTYQEGLPRSMMEAMSAGLPCVASKIRGNVDLIKDGQGGILCDPDDIVGFAKAITTLAHDKKLCSDMKQSNLNTITSYDIENVKKSIFEIYAEQL